MISHEASAHYSWVVDRFHLSAAAYQALQNGRELDFGWLEDRLVPLAFRLLCTRAGDTFATARPARLPASGKPDQYDDLSVFVEEQQAAAARSDRCCEDWDSLPWV